MAAKVMLVPNPNKSGAIDRVIVIGKSEDQQRLRVLNIDALSQNPKLLRPFNSGYYYATMFWNVVSSLILVGGIILSFLWQWWAFIAGFVIAFVVFRSNKTSVADFAEQSLREHAEAYEHFASLGLVWEVSPESLVAA